MYFMSENAKFELYIVYRVRGGRLAVAINCPAAAQFLHCLYQIKIFNYFLKMVEVHFLMMFYWCYYGDVIRSIVYFCRLEKQ